MKKFLERAPLVSAVIHLNFSDIPSLVAMKQDTLNALHSAMIDAGFPEKIETPEEIVKIKFDALTNEANHVKNNQMRYSFRASGEQEIIEVSKNSIIFKTTKYRTFDDFHEKFQRVINSCLHTIEGFNKNILLKNLSLRYVNVIVPSKNFKLSDYVTEGLIPVSLTDVIKYNSFLHGVSAKAVETNKGQVLKVQFEELPTVDEGKIHKILPNDLMEPDANCALIIEGHQEWLAVESESYGILDINHEHAFLGSPNFQLSIINETANELYKHTNQVFWGVITEHAKTSWGFKEVEHVEH